jgi:hypothetical protein
MERPRVHAKGTVVFRRKQSVCRFPRSPEAGFLVRVHPEPCLILSRAEIRALLCSSKSKFIPAQTLTLLVLDKKTGLSKNSGLTRCPKSTFPWDKFLDKFLTDFLQLFDIF